MLMILPTAFLVLAADGGSASARAMARGRIVVILAMAALVIAAAWGGNGLRDELGPRVVRVILVVALLFAAVAQLIGAQNKGVAGWWDDLRGVGAASSPFIVFGLSASSSEWPAVTIGALIGLVAAVAATIHCPPGWRRLAGIALIAVATSNIIRLL